MQVGLSGNDLCLLVSMMSMKIGLSGNDLCLLVSMRSMKVGLSGFFNKLDVLSDF